MLEDLGVALPDVELSFSTDAKPATAWRVLSFDAWEHLAGGQAPYQATIELVSPDTWANPLTLGGSSCTLTLSRGEVIVRRFHGIARSATLSGWDQHEIHARVEIVPAFACLDEGSTFRRFDGLSVPEILKDVLTASLAPYGRELELTLTDEPSKERRDRYLRRDLVIQRNESVLSFARRLMEEEGISFYFVDAGDREKLVLVDGNVSYPEVHEGVPVRIEGASGARPRCEAVQTFSLGVHPTPRSFSAKTFDPTRAGASLAGRANASDRTSDGARLPTAFGREEIYEFGAGIQSSGYQDRANTELDAEAKARVRAQELEARSVTGHGTGFVTAFAAGRRFQLSGGLQLVDREYLLIGVAHHGEGSGLSSGRGAAGSGPTYWNSFECIPATLPFRPPRATKRPRATFDIARVTGPAGQQDDIHVDEHGRIRVRFIWSRDDLDTDQPDEKRECWIPVAQGWLGSAMGMQVIPRRGMIVLVGYIDGDPDRPIALHCIESSSTSLPYELPAEKTRTVFFRTRTSPPGQAPRKNEISANDAAEKEQLFIHAGRDLLAQIDEDARTIVARNERHSVGGTQDLTVTGVRTVTARADERLTTKGFRETTAEQSNSLTVHGLDTLTVVGNRHAAVTETEELEAKNRATTIAETDSLHVLQTREVTVDQRLVIRQGDTTIECSAGDVQANIAGTLTVHRGAAHLTVDQEGNVTVATTAKLSLNAGGASLVLGDGKAQINAETEIQIGVGGSTVKLDAAGVATNGTQITDTAEVLHQTSAPVIAQG